MSGLNLADLGVAEIVRATTSGDIAVGQVVEDCLTRIAGRDPDLNAFSVVLAEQARAEAERLDESWAPSGLGPLFGVPVAIKEEIDVAGCVTTFGGRANTTPATADAELVRRLRAAGAVIIGKTNMPEFGQWPFTESIARGVTRNPWDRTRTPGGSSGGSAVAVAAGMVPVAIGGDGGGSIRIPAACTGLFGLKPERGRVSTAPAPHLWWALGTAGPLSRSVLDSAIVYDVLRGNVGTDMFRAPEPATSFVEAAVAEQRPLRIGWSLKPVSRGVKVDVQSMRAVRETADLLQRLGHTVTEVDPHYPDPTAVFVPQFFGGVRSEADEVEHFNRLEPRTRQVYRLGAWVREGVLAKVVDAGDRLSTKANRVFDDVDVLLTPTIACRPPKVGTLDRGGAVTQTLKAMPMIAYTALWNVTGNPAASVPAGVGPDGLPLAVQFVGRRGEETTLLTLSAQLERERPWAMPTWGSPA